jgi:signal transduction histidine kinase
MIDILLQPFLRQLHMRHIYIKPFAFLGCLALLFAASPLSAEPTATRPINVLTVLKDVGLNPADAHRLLEGEIISADLEEGSQKELVGKILAKEEDVDIDFLVEEIPQAIEQSQNGIKLVSTIVSAMRDFSHIDDRRKTSADLNKALASTIVILRNELKYVADVIKDFDENLPEIVCCVDDLHQVFLNLLINAAHSIEERINTGQTQRGEITVKTFQQGSEVIVSVSDTGMGISPEIREKIFEPFFTTKSKDRKGTGQGLAMVMSIVEGKHEGKVELTSEVGVGTTFTVKLPIESNNERQE